MNLEIAVIAIRLIHIIKHIHHPSHLNLPQSIITHHNIFINIQSNCTTPAIISNQIQLIHIASPSASKNQHNTTQHNTTQHIPTQDNTTYPYTTQHNTSLHNTTQHTVRQYIRRNTIQYNTTHNTVITS